MNEKNCQLVYTIWKVDKLDFNKLVPVAVD